MSREQFTELIKKMWKLAEMDIVPVVKESQGHIIITIFLDNLGFMKLRFCRNKMYFS